MKQIKIRPNHHGVNFKDVVEVADRMAWTGRLPSVDAISEELNAGNTDKVRQCLTLWEAGYNHIQAVKTHIAELPLELQHLLVEAFEKRATALEAKMNVQSNEIRVDRERLLDINERQAAQIEALILALGDAEVKIADQERRISSLKKEIDVGRDALAKAEQRIRDAGLEFTVQNAGSKLTPRMRMAGLEVNRTGSL